MRALTKEQRLEIMRESVMETFKEEQLAKILNQSVQTLRNHRFLGKGVPYVKIGRSVRYLVEDVERFLKENRIDTNSARV